MAAAEIGISAEPIDAQRCKFVVSVPVFAGGVRRFTGSDDAKGSPLAEAIFAIPGLAVNELIVSGNIVTVVKQSPTPWQAVGKPVGAAIRAALASDVPPVAAAPKPAGSTSRSRGCSKSRSTRWWRDTAGTSSSSTSRMRS